MNEEFFVDENEENSEPQDNTAAFSLPSSQVNQYSVGVDASLARLSNDFATEDTVARSANIETGLATDPVKWGKAKRIAERRNTDVDLVFNNFEEFEAKDKELLLADIVNKNPALKELSAESPEFMKLAANDCDKLQEISNNLTIFGTMEKPIKPVAMAKTAAYLYNENERRLDLYEEIGDLMTKEDDESNARLAVLVDEANKASLVDTSGFADFGYNFVEQLPYMKRTMLPKLAATAAGAGADALVSAKAGAAGGAAVGSVAPGAGTAAGAVVGGVGGAVVGTVKGAMIGNAIGTAVAFKNTYDVESGSMFANLAVMKDENGQSFDRSDMVAIARTYGALSAAVELLPMETMARLVPGYNVAKKGMLKAGFKKAVQEALKDKTKAQLLRGILKDMTFAAGSEGLEESVQELLQVVGERHLQDKYNDKQGYNFEKTPWNDDIARISNAGYQGFKASLIMPIVSGSARAYVETKALNEVRAIDSLQRGDGAKAELDAARMDNVQNQIQQLGELKEQPEQLKVFLQRATRQSDLRDVYMSIEDAKALLQSEAVKNNEDALQKLGVLDSMRRQIANQQEQGGAVKISFADYGATVMSRQELYAAFKDVVKTYEDGMTMNELRQKQKSLDNIVAEGKKLKDKNQSDFDYIYGRLVENAAIAGIQPEQAKTTAELNAYFYLGLARLHDMSPVQMFQNDSLNFDYKIDGQPARSAQLDKIIDVIREEQIKGADQNLLRASRVVARKDINAIKKTLMNKIENPNTADVKEYIRLLNAISDMKINLEGMSNEDFAGQLKAYTAQSPITVDIARSDADKIKSGIFSASEKALADIQDKGASGDYVLVGGGRVPVNYEIVELGDLVTSHNADGAVNEAFPQELQPRDRSRSASDAQINEIVNNFAPERVAKAPTATEGAPIVTQNNIVAVGNGRAMAISKVYENAEKAEQYRNYLTEQGYDVENFAEPVLVRKLAIDLDNNQLRALVDDANTAGTMQYSDAEKAITYSKKLTGEIIDLLDTDAELESAANRRFVREFFANVVPTAERNAFLDKDDRVTKKGIEMIENTLTAIIVPDVRFLSVLVENPDNNIRKVTSGLAKSAPAIVAFENDILSGQIDAKYSIAPDIRQAVEILKRAKDKGQSLDLYVKQLDLLEGHIPAEVLAVADLFDKSRSAVDFADKIKNYIHNASEQGDLAQGNMFGIEPVAKIALLERMNAQNSLFQRETEKLFKPTRIEKSNYIVDLRNAEQSTGNENKIIRLGELPAVYKAIGIPAAKVNTDKKTVIKDVIKKHTVPMSVVEMLPELYADPIMVFKALDKSTNKNSYVAVLNAFDKDGKQMIAAISPTNKEVGYHMITSFYGRTNIENMINTAFAENKVRYVQDKKNSLLTGHNAYLSQANNNILQKEDIVKDNNIIFYQRADRDNLTGDLFAQPANEQGNPLPVSVKKQVDDLFSYAEKQDGVTKELPLFSTVGESKKIEKTYQSSKQIVDAGDSLLGNLKRNAKVYTWEELEGMNDLLRRKYVTKTYIYPRLTIDDLRGRGIDGRAAALVEYVYNALNVKPAKNVNDTLANQKRFFDVIHRTMETVIKYAKAHKTDIEAWQTDMGFNYDLFHAVFPSDETNPRLVFSRNKEYNIEALVAGGNKFLSALMISGYDLAKLDTIAEDFDKQIKEKTTNKADVEQWQKHFMVVKRAYQDSWFVVDNNGKSISRDLSFVTQEKAAEFAKKAYELVKPYLKGQGETVDFSGMRTGLPRRQNDQNVNPEALMETFGFRGVNFGNWTKQSERQEFLNLTYDSLLDMTEILGIPPKAIGLEGKLGLAFGAQGRAGAAGHFMPEFNEINLTRKDGAGSLAHEWWHALDYYFGDQSLGKDYSGHAVLELDKQGNLRSETYEAIRNLYQQISTADMSDKEVEDRYEAQVRRTQFMINNRASEIKNKFARAKNSEQINKFIDDMVAQGKNYDATKDEKYLSDFQDMIEERRRTAELAGLFFDLQYRLRQLVKLDDNTSSWRKVSKYYDTAVKLNRVTKKKNGYWTQRTELGARAFASYINDKVASNGWYNFFLAGHAKAGILDEYSYLEALIDAEKTGKKADINNYMLPVYPADEAERTNINAAFDRLFKTIKVDENNNFRLYQNQKIDMEALGAYSPTSRTITLFKNANLSTLIHESGHFWREMIRKYAAMDGASEQLKAYNETLENWLDSEWSKHNEVVVQPDGSYTLFYNGEKLQEGFASRDDAIDTAKHECFARAVEKYFRTAEAPSFSLRKLFATFKGWLTRIYTNAEKLDVEISPEVKDIFDRLLASDGEIEQYVLEKRIRQMFEAPDKANMSQKQFDAYKQYMDNMLTVAKDDYYKSVAALAYKEKTAEFENKKEALRHDVLMDFSETPENRFVIAMVYGVIGDTKVDIKANAAEIKEIFNRVVDNGADRLPKRPDGSAIFADDGMSIAELSDFFGLSADIIKKQLSQSPKLVTAIEDTLRYRVHEELGSPVSYAEVEAQIVKSLHNEKYFDMLSLELSKISPNPDNQGAMEHALQARAEDIIGGLRITDIKPEKYFNQSLKAGDNAIAALNRGNKNAAYSYKRQQLMNFFLYREAQKQAERVEKTVRRLKEIGKKEVNPAVNQQHQDAVRAILGRYSLANALTKQQKERLGNLSKFIDEQRAAGYDIDIPAGILEAIDKKPYTEMSVDELLSMADLVKNIIHNGREIKTYELSGLQVEKEKLLGEIAAQLAKSYKPREQAKTGKQTKHFFRDFAATVDENLVTLGGLCERIDDNDSNGVFHRAFLRPLTDAQNMENDLLQRFGSKMNELNKKLSEETKGALFENVEGAKEMLGADYTLGELISIGLNMGNYYNKQRMKANFGNRYNDALGWVAETLTKEQWDYIQGVWDLLDSMYPMLAEHQKKMSGLDMDQVVATPVVTPYGVYRGGYYPIVYDKTASMEARDKNSAETALLESDYGRATTAKGYTKSRLDRVNAPLKFGLAPISQHIASVIHDVAYRQTIRQLWNLVNSPTFMENFDIYLEPEYRDGICQLLKTIANQPNRDARAMKQLDKFLKIIRTRTTTMGLAFRFTTAVAQTLGFFSSVAALDQRGRKKGAKHSGKYWLWRGLKAFAQGAENREWALANSGELRARLNNNDVNIAEAMKGVGQEISRKEKITDSMVKAGFWLIGKVDFVVAQATWFAAYEQAKNEFGYEHQDAVFYADRIMIDSQGTGNLKDTPLFQRNGEIYRSMAMFYSPFAGLYQIWTQSVKDMKDNKQFAGAVHDLFVALVLPPLVEGLLKGDAPDADDGLAEWLKYLLCEPLFYWLSTLPIARDAASVMEFGRVPGSLYANAVNTVWSPVKRVYKMLEGKDVKESAFVKDLMNAISLSSGVPVGGQIADWTSYGLGAMTGSVKVDSPADVIYGIYRGKERKK